MTNETAVEKLDALIGDAISFSHSVDETINNVLAAFQADPMAYVKPKPLEWVRSRKDRRVCVVHGYVVFKSYDDAFVLMHRGRELGRYATLEAAQAAAEEDLHRRVGELF